MKNVVKFLRGMVLFFLVSVSVFAGGTKEETEAPKVSAMPAASKYNEAPMLAEMVKAGKLPSVDQRLPEEPYVQKVVEEIGKYGGMLRVVSNEASKLGDGRNTVGRPMAVKYDFDAATKSPHFVKKWEFSDDGKVITLYYRKGVKWSDGQPFTTEDLRFWYEDVLLNKDLNPSLYPAWKVGGELMKMESVDDYTVRLKFAAPNPLFLENLAIFAENHWEDGWVYPSHYMKPFHPRYRPKGELDKLVKEKGFNNWWELFKYMSPRLEDAWSVDKIGIPTLRSHTVTEVGPNYIVMTRNPYYWKVDPAGNQLPYIDKIYTQIVERELYQGKVAAGEADFAIRRTDLENLALYKSGEASGNYKVYFWKSVITGEFEIL
ncbi:MAG: ABC transporter substrate-binding protein, partial [Spirochaetota bacterium]